MANLINDNDTLKKYVPNTLKAVAGELSLFDKIQYHLLQAEQWLTDTFVSSDTMSRIRTYSDSTPLLHYCRIITAAEAMLHAVPQLDLILTPNGVLQSGTHGHASHRQHSQCLFLNKVDTLKSTIMKKKEEQLQISLDRVKLQKHVYELCRVQKLTINEVRKKTGLGMGTIYRYLHTFEEENPKLVEQMKKQGPNIIPEDYKKLQEEVLRLKCELKRERLRADFYEEMVAFGKEVYGIDLKKAGTK